MMRTLPGAVTRNSLRGLVLVDRPDAVTVVCRHRASGSETIARSTNLRGSIDERLGGELDRRRIVPWRFETLQLQAGSDYELRAYCGADRTASTFRTPPNLLGSEGMTLAVASCFFDGYDRGGHYLRAVQSPCHFQPPLLKLLVGDNLYLDVGPNDDHDQGFDHTVYRYLRYFWELPYADALAASPSLTTYDDHELWNNYPEAQTWLSRSRFGTDHRSEYTAAGLAGIDLFQGTLNPDGVGGPDSRSYRHDLPGLSLFVADLRCSRTLFDDADRRRHGAGGPRRLMAPADLAALEIWCRTLERPGVLVLGQPLWLAAGGGTDYNPAAFADDYERIWSAIADARRDVLLVSGDVHYSRAIELDLGGRKVVEFVSSPASHIPTTAGVVAGATLGGTWSQGQGTVEYERKYPGRSPSTLGHRTPRLQRYLMGTDAPNTMGLLHFTPVNTGIEVGAAMVDLKTNRAARPTTVDRPGWFTGSDRPVHYHTCYTPLLCTLN
jgi:hypothetical protein